MGLQPVGPPGRVNAPGRRSSGTIARFWHPGHGASRPRIRRRSRLTWAHRLKLIPLRHRRSGYGATAYNLENNMHRPFARRADRVTGSSWRKGTGPPTGSAPCRARVAPTTISRGQSRADVRIEAVADVSRGAPGACGRQLPGGAPLRRRRGDAGGRGADAWTSSTSPTPPRRSRRDRPRRARSRACTSCAKSRWRRPSTRRARCCATRRARRAGDLSLPQLQARAGHQGGARDHRVGRGSARSTWSRCRPSATRTPRASPSGAPTGGASAATRAAASRWTTAATRSTWRSNGCAPTRRRSARALSTMGPFDTEDDFSLQPALSDRRRVGAPVAGTRACAR